MESKKLILIVEDEKINRIILKRILSKKYKIIEACNGKEAWEIIKERKKDLGAVLTDILMPICDGYELLDRVKAAGIREIPIIVMTSDANKDSEVEALERGAWDYVTKPYHEKVITRRLENALSRRQVAMLEEIERLATYDSLTGLQNRNCFFDKAQFMVQQHPEITFQLIRVDIDHFSLYNSAFGEQEGDKLICFMADMSRTFIKKYQYVEFGRISADIFAMCVPYEENRKSIESDVQSVQEQLVKYREDYLLEVSVGVYIISESDIGITECYRRATLGAQKCKRKYGKHIGYYDEIEGRQEEIELSITNEMQRALSDHQFVVFLQPKYDITKEMFCGAEALVRWKHPQKGIISPGLFVPVFEKNGFISEMDYYVWEETCKMLKDWMNKGAKPYPVSVNISRVSLNNPQLVEMLEGLLDKYQIDVEKLQLEITETAYMSNPEHMRDTVKKLRNAGFTVLMDDFGSEYSSLNTLKNIQMDMLKIDMKFLEIGDTKSKGEIVIASVIKMARWLGMQVIVEGVETKEQRDFLQGTGCKYVQGFYYARPIPKAEYEELYIFDHDDYIKHGASLYNGNEITNQDNIILIVDDDPGTRNIIQKYFEDEYMVAECESAESALLYLQKNANNVQLILVDYIMNGMSGLDFLIYCQDDEKLSIIPKILVTAADDVETQTLAFENGAYDYIPKPFVMRTVKARVEHAMGIGRQIRALADIIKDNNSLEKILDETKQLIQISDCATLSMMYANQSAREFANKRDYRFKGEKCYQYMMGLEEQCSFCPLRELNGQEGVTKEIDNGEQVFNVETRLITWEGKEAFVEYATDITAIRRAQKSFDYQMKELVDSIPEAQEIFHINLTKDEWFSSNGISKIVNDLRNSQNVNELVSSLSSYIPDELMCKRVYQSLCRESLLEAFSNGRNEIQEETLSYYDDGSIRRSRITARLIMNPMTGDIEGVIYGIDISDERKYKENPNMIY